MKRLVFAVALLLVGCGSAPEIEEPFEDLGEPTEEDLKSIVSERSGEHSLDSLYAELTLRMQSEDLEGEFDAVFHWTRSPRRMRFSAFKDIILATDLVFDLVLTPDRYALEFVAGPGEEPIRSSGDRKAFPSENPRFAAFYWTAEALFMPGMHSDWEKVRATLPENPEALISLGEIHLSSGERGKWLVEPRSLRVVEGHIGVYTIRYHDYEPRDPWFMPTRVELIDEPGDMKTTAEIDYVEENPDIDPTLFDIPGPPSGEIP